MSNLILFAQSSPQGLIIGVLVGVVVCIIAAVAHYNGLVNLKNLIRDSWANVETELKRRYELIPNLVSTVKGYAKHEQEVFEKITQARTQAMNATGSKDKAEVENQLIGCMKSLLAVSENYPELKADEQFLKLQKELVNTEDRIQAARRFFNANVRDYNNKVEMFPSNIIATLGGFKRHEFFETEDVGWQSVKF